MNGLYSDNLCCILLLMLQWENVTRPDFITLEHLIKNDILQLTSEGAAAGLFKRLCATMAQESDQVQPVQISIPKVSKKGANTEEEEKKGEHEVKS